MKLTKPLVVLDLETTGTWVEKDRIIEIAMIKTDLDGTENRFHALVDPNMPIPPVVTELTGISNKDVEGKPRFKEIAPSVIEFIGDADIAGFNVDRFDLPLLEREIHDANLPWIAKAREIYDAQKIFHVNEKRDLTAAYQFYCQKNLDNAHSAMADTQATLEILKAQIAQYSEGTQNIEVLGKFNYQVNGFFYDKNRKFRWWNGKLYMMFGKHARRLSLQEVAHKDPSYLEWILSADFSSDVKDLVKNALEGCFPIPKSEE